MSEFLHNYSLQVKKLDDSEFRNAFSRSYVRVCIKLDASSIALFLSVGGLCLLLHLFTG